MKRFFLIRILFLVSAFMVGSLSTCYAEETYSQLLYECVQKSSGNLLQNKEKIVKSFSAILVKDGYSEEMARQKSSTYFDEVIVKDYLEWIETMYKPVMSEQDLKNVLDFYHGDAGKLALEHSDVYNGEEAQAKIQIVLTPNVMKIALGEKPEKVKSTLPKSYQKLFQEYCELSGLDETIDVLIKQIISISAMGEDEKFKKELVKYMTDNLGTLMMEVGYPTMTENDFNAMMNFYKTPSGKRLKEVSSSVAKEIMKFSLSMVMKFSMAQKEWEKEDVPADSVIIKTVD